MGRTIRELARWEETINKEKAGKAGGTVVETIRRLGRQQAEDTGKTIETVETDL